MNQDQQISPLVIKIINSIETYNALKKIGEKHNLLLDQLGYLDVATRQVLLGQVASSAYVDTLAKELEISKQTAEKIAADINTDIFIPLKEAIRKNQQGVEASLERPDIANPASPAPRPPIAPIEGAGDFKVVPRPPSHSPLYNDQTLTKAAVLADLENIEKLKPEKAADFVEHLLPKPPQETEVSKPLVQSEPPIQPTPVTPPQSPSSQPPVEQKRFTADPYREAI